MKELPIPPEAVGDERSVELARVWAASGKQYVTLATGLWDDPGAWGIMLVDLAKHVANAYAELSQYPREEALRLIKSGFDAEWGHATDQPTGRIME